MARPTSASTDSASASATGQNRSLRRRWIALLGAVVAMVSGWLACSSSGRLVATVVMPADWDRTRRLIRDRYPDVPSLSTADLAAVLARSDAAPPILLDVREPDEFAVSHLPGARQVDPNATPEALSDLPKNQPIICYCSVGYRSAGFTQKLQRAGYTNVRNLDGSIFQWANESRPLVRNNHPTAEVHPYNDRWGKLLNPQVPQLKKPPG